MGTIKNEKEVKRWGKVKKNNTHLIAFLSVWGLLSLDGQMENPQKKEHKPLSQACTNECGGLLSISL